MSEHQLFNSAMIEKESRHTANCDVESECSLDDLFDTPCKSTRKTQVICTISKKCSDVDTIRKFLDKGMNVARFSIKPSNV